MAAATAENLNGVPTGFQWSPGICLSLRVSPLVSLLLFEWAEFDARLEHIASTDLLQSVVFEQSFSA